MLQYFRNIMLKKPKPKSNQTNQTKKEYSQNIAPTYLQKANRNVDTGLCPGLLISWDPRQKLGQHAAKRY